MHHFEMTPRPRSRLSNTQRLTARGAGILVGSVALATFLGVVAKAPATTTGIYAGTLMLPGPGLELELDSTRDALAAAQQELKRARVLINYSARYNIGADLAAMVYDVATEEGVDPELAFRIVNHESRFDPRAVSRAAAYGLAQVQLPTARFYQPDITAEDLFTPELNLHIGFRYLNELLTQFDGDLQFALIAYNRGPGRLRQLLAGGISPWNGYARSILDGYRGVAPGTGGASP